MGGFFEPGIEKLPGPEKLESPEMQAGIKALQTLLESITNLQIPKMAMTPAEERAQSLLFNLMGQPVPDIYKKGEAELGRTLEGGYEPATSPYYSALRKASEIEEAKGVSDIRRRSQLGGMLLSEPSERTEAEYRERAGASRGMMLGGLTEAERTRRFGAVPLALQYSQQRPEYQALAAAKQYGGLPRDIALQNLQNMLIPYQLGTPIAQALSSYQPYYQPQYMQKPSGFENLMRVLELGADVFSTIKTAGTNKAIQALSASLLPAAD